MKSQWGRDKVRPCPCFRLPVIWVNEHSSVSCHYDFFFSEEQFLNYKSLHSDFIDFSKQASQHDVLIVLIGWKMSLLHLMNHTEMMWSTYFTQILQHVSTANQTKSSSCSSFSTTNQSHSKSDNDNDASWCLPIGANWMNFFLKGVRHHLLLLWFYLPHLPAHHPFIFCTSALPSLLLSSLPYVLLVCGQQHQA